MSGRGGRTACRTGRAAARLPRHRGRQRLHRRFACRRGRARRPGRPRAATRIRRGRARRPAGGGDGSGLRARRGRLVRSSRAAQARRDGARRPGRPRRRAASADLGGRLALACPRRERAGRRAATASRCAGVRHQPDPGGPPDGAAGPRCPRPRVRLPPGAAAARGRVGLADHRAGRRVRAPGRRHEIEGLRVGPGHAARRPGTSPGCCARTPAVPGERPARGREGTGCRAGQDAPLPAR